MQGITDGHKPIVCHQSNKQTVYTSKNNKYGHLCQAVHIGDVDSGSSESYMRRNFDTDVIFCGLMLLGHLPK
jgi:hypothetical protein